MPPWASKYLSVQTFDTLYQILHILSRDSVPNVVSEKMPSETGVCFQRVASSG